MRYTIDQLVAHMRQGPANFGWDAIVAYDRPKANKVLAQQYIERFTQADNVFRRLEGEVPTTEGEIEYVYDYLMDSPRLSFVNSPITQSKALLTLKILGGSQFTIVSEAGRSAAINKVAEYDALQSIPYTMDVDLMTAAGNITTGGKVMLDLKQGRNPLLYLGPTDRQRTRGGVFVLNKIKSMEPTVTTFTLNDMFKYEPDQLVRVKRFDVRTHMEPGAGRASAPNYGEGAVLLFAVMHGNDNATPTFPADDDKLKFLIPQGGYSSATLLAQRLVLGQILGEGLKYAYGGVQWKTFAAPNNFIGVELTQGTWYGGSFDVESADVELFRTNFSLPMIGRDTFSLVVTEDVVRLKWGGTHSGNSLAKVRYDPDIASVYWDLTWEISVDFQFKLEGENGELHLVPVYDSWIKQLNLRSSPPFEGQWFEPYFDQITPTFKMRVLNGFTALIIKFASIVIQVDDFRLNDLLFKGGNVVNFTDVRLPGDLVVFGTLAPTVGVFDIEPIEHIMGAGSSYTFGINPAQSVTWSVEKIEGYTGPAGLITSLGVYTAPTKKQLEDQGLLFLRVRLKAVKAGAVAYALVTVVLRAISINPLVTTCTAPRPGDTPQTREFAGGSLAAGALSWAVAGNTGSTIVPSNTVEGGQTYTPRSASVDPEEYFTLDEVVATDSGGTRESSWVLVEHGGLLGEIKIVDAPGLLPGQIKFSLQNSTGTPFPDVTYRVIKGGGEIDPDTGVYTSNAQEAYRFALITAIGVSPMEPYPAAHSYFILPLPVIDLPILLNVLDRSDKYFKAARTLGMDEAMRVAGINQG